MRTVRSLIEELQTFPPEAACFAYEGEVTGVIVNHGKQQGIVYCNEGTPESEEPETEPV